MDLWNSHENNKPKCNILNTSPVVRSYTFTRDVRSGGGGTLFSPNCIAKCLPVFSELPTSLLNNFVKIVT